MNRFNLTCLFFLTFAILAEAKVKKNDLPTDCNIRSLTENERNVCSTFDFTIEGSIEDIEKGYAILYNDEQILAQTQIVNNRYQLKGKLKDRKQCTVILIKEHTDFAVAMYTLYIQEGTLKAETFLHRNLHKTRFTDAPIQKEIEAIEDELYTHPDYKDYQRISVSIQKEFKKNSTAPKHLQDRQGNFLFNALCSQLKGGNKEYEEAVGIVIAEYASALTSPQIETLYKALSPQGRSSLAVREMMESNHREYTVAEGKIAPDFKAKDLKGNVYTLDSFQGKFIFLEFSASWCGWCKKEIPYIKEAYEALKEENIVFVTMMMDDKRENWERDVKKFQIPWFSLSDLKGIKRSEIARNYNISSVPVSFLINPSGKIVKKDLRGKDILPLLKKHIQ